MHFANPAGITEEAGGEIEGVTEITTLEDGTRHTIVVPSSRGYVDSSHTVQTETGTMQLVRIQIPGEAEAQTAWLNILPSDQ